jgi:hypothetical protein
VQQDQNLKPKYEVEPLPIRIGHGFDIHKMVPLKDAGQPIVIAGVVIDHKDLKVHLYSLCIYHTFSGMMNRFFTIQLVFFLYSGSMSKGSM